MTFDGLGLEATSGLAAACRSQETALCMPNAVTHHSIKGTSI